MSLYFLTESYKFNLHVVPFDAHFNYNIDNSPHIELDVVFACFHLPSLVRTLGISTKLMAHSSKPTVPGVAHMLATCCSNTSTKYSIHYIETSEANRVHTSAQLPKSCPFIIYVNYSCFSRKLGHSLSFYECTFSSSFCFSGEIRSLCALQ